MDLYNLDFLKDDIEEGLLKNKRVGMIRRTITIKGGVVSDHVQEFPQFNEFVVLNIKSRFE